MYAMSRMGRLRRSVGRFLGVLALTGSALFAATVVAAPPAFADGASNCSSMWILCTTIQYGGSYTPTPRDPTGTGGNGSGGGYISSCWLQPNTAWQNPNQDASSPAGLQQYFADMGTALAGNRTFDAWLAAVQGIYQNGKNADTAAIGLSKPPYNQGLTNGRWYAIACDRDTFKLTDYTAIQAAMGVSAANLQYEAWFWIKNGQPPKGVQVVTPAMLANYAANHVQLAAQFPRLSPPVTSLQTVNLAVQSINTAGQNGFQQYTTTATLAGITSTVTAYPVSVTYTATPGSLLSPASVTCSFDKYGTIQSPCPTFTFTAPAAAGAGDSITATTAWNVTWTGNAGYNEGGWDKPLFRGKDMVFNHPVTVQEIQTIN